MKKDKFNDNLLFSCCCAHVDWTWTTVCDCWRGGWKCDQGQLSIMISLLRRLELNNVYSYRMRRNCADRGISFLFHWNCTSSPPVTVYELLTTDFRSRRTESVQQSDLHVPRIKHMDHRTFTRWCSGFSRWCNVWCSCSGI